MNTDLVNYVDVVKLRALLSEIAGDCRVAYGVTEENYRAFCRNGAMGKIPSSTWPEHCQRRLEQIEKAIAALDAQVGMVCEECWTHDRPGGEE